MFIESYTLTLQYLGNNVIHSIAESLKKVRIKY